MNYTLKHDGDDIERHYYEQIIPLFPSYETFWVNQITPLTQRPVSIHFKNDKDLMLLGKTDENILLAKLHYTIFRKLVRSLDISTFLKNKTQSEISDLDTLGEGLFNLIVAQDNAFEFLERNYKIGGV